MTEAPAWGHPGTVGGGRSPHQHAGPPAAELSSGLLKAHGPHPLQLAPADSVPLAASALGPLAPVLRVREQHGGQLTVHVNQLLCLDHIFYGWKVQRGSKRLKCRIYII